MPLAARLLDMHTCPLLDGLKPHVGGPITGPGVPTVLIGGMPAAVVGDVLACAGPPDAIANGSLTVMIGGRPAARQTDLTAHGGLIAAGCPTVMIGDAAGGGGGGSATGAGGDSSITAVAAQIGAALLAAAVSAVRVPRSPQAHALLEAAEEGAPLVEKCPLARARGA
jgi:uncharacterized Zn-binding protein involved in type VI secretion